MRKVLKLILVLIFANTVLAQTQPNDCVNAITVCGNGSFTSNASGSGNVQEVNACGSLEHNSLWLKINIVQAGTLGFDLIPDDPSLNVDYDFWVFGPNPVCGALSSPIRCATTNPEEANLDTNLTGINGSTLSTQAGPANLGNGYVYWLNVLPGQTYYIAIDRPHGDGGFQIQWTGTAMAGSGAFTTPPTANSIPDVKTCSNTPNVGIYSLDAVKSLINSNTIANNITFHTTIEDAIDNINPLPNIYSNVSNPETIYVRVTDVVSGCYSTTTFNLVVNQVPNASVNISQTSICNGDSVTVTFTGTPNANIDYTVNGGVTQSVFLNASGLYNIVYTPTGNTTFTLIGARALDGSGNVICFQTLNQSVSVNVGPVLSATVSGTTTICAGDTAVITFNGTSNATVTYTVDNGPNQTILLDGTGFASITTPALTTNSIYDLVSIATTIPACSKVQSGSATITVSSLPTATISGSTSICSGSTTIVTFNGTPNAEITYTINGGSNQTITLNATGSATLTTPPLTANTFYELVSAAIGTSCSQIINGLVVITISTPPTAAISGTTMICSGDSATITFTGTANAIVTYTVNGGSNQTIVLDGIGSATLTSTFIATTTYTLVSVSFSGTPSCSQTISGSAIVTVKSLPTVSISGATEMICEGGSTIINFIGTPYAIVSYTVNGGSTQTVNIGPAGNVGVITGVLNTDTTYSLVSVQDNDGTTLLCNQNISGSVLVKVNPYPVITNISTNRLICSSELVTTPPFIITPSTALVTWTNSEPSIGLPVSGVGNIPNFTANNITTVPITATITIQAVYEDCPSTWSYTITVNPLPLANPVILDYELCDYNSPGDEQEIFTLNSKSAEIANGQTGVTVSYYATQQDAIDRTNALPNSYPNGSNPQRIWINIRNNATGCNTVSSFNLVVNPLPLAVTPLPIFECSNGAVTTAEFDLTVNENVITGGTPGRVVTYYHTLAEAQTPSSPITPPTAYMGNDGETIYVRVENIQTGCYSTTTQLLRVTQGPVAVTPQPLHYCDPNNDGFGVFDLESTRDEIAGGSLPLGVTVTYHETETDALLGSNALSSPYPNIVPNQQTIYVKVFYITTGCSNYVELELIVDPTPEATAPSAYHLCDYTGAVGFESFNLLSYIPQILGGINPLTHTVTFYTSLPQAELGTGFITTPGNYTNGTINQETIYVRVENNTTGCYDIVTLDLIVDPLPQSLQPNYPQYSLCDVDQSSIGFEVFDLSSQIAPILLGQTGMSVTFYPSLLDAQNNSNAITNLNYENTIIYVQTLGIRITNETTGCYVISTMDIRVEPLPTPIPLTSPYTICDSDQDGFAEFDLSTLVNDILGGANYLLSFHETLTNAQTNDDALPMLYTNIHPFVQIIYLRAEDPDTHCVNIITIELNVNPSPVAPISLAPIEICDTDSSNQSGTMNVNLTIRTGDILAQQPLPASSYVVTYYTNSTDAGLGNDPIVNVMNYHGYNGQIIWVRVENIATGCYNVGSFELIIGIPLLVATPQPINQCDTAPNDQYAVFDLTVRTITTLPGYTIQYYPSLSQAQSNSNEITNITSYQNTSPAVQTLGVKITSPQGCVSYTTLNIRVLPVPTPNTNPQVLPAVCENGPNSGQATVDLTQNQTYIINGDPNVTLHYFPTLTDLENNTNEITNPSAALVGDTTLTDDPIGLVQYVYIAVSSNNNIDYSGRNCYTIVPQGYIINPLPIVDIIGTTNVYQICESDPTGNDNIEVFNLTSQIPDLLEGNVTTPTSNYSVSFYEDAALTSLIGTPSAYTNTSNPQTIYVVITNTTTGCVSQPGQFDIQVNPKPIIAVALSDLDFTTCDDQDGVNDGQALHQYDPLSLSGSVAQILGATQSPTDYDVTFYYNSQSNAEAGINSVVATAAVQTGTYWVRVEDKATGCYITGSFSVVVEQLAEPNVVANTTIACVDFGDTVVNNTLILDSQVTGNYTFEWYADGVLIPGATSSTLTVTEMTQDEVEFSVIAISNAPGLGCRSDDVPQRTKITITRSGVASNVSYTVSNAFSDLQTITITYDGYGEYHFSLDDGPILDNGGVFTDVPMGEHTVHVWDMRDPNYSCGVVSISGVQVIDYPHYFTPNGDGIHDTWNIKGLKNFADETKIYIFDRYGKLLKQISSAGDGWDGTFNGQLMPSSDYWFRVEYPEQGVMKEFKAHFSLKR